MTTGIESKSGIRFNVAEHIAAAEPRHVQIEENQAGARSGFERRTTSQEIDGRTAVLYRMAAMRQ